MKYDACNGKVHKIEKGDTLYALSRQYHVPLAMILQANPYVDVYNLQIGDTICIPGSRPPAYRPPRPRWFGESEDRTRGDAGDDWDDEDRDGRDGRDDRDDRDDGDDGDDRYDRRQQEMGIIQERAIRGEELQKEAYSQADSVESETQTYADGEKDTAWEGSADVWRARYASLHTYSDEDHEIGRSPVYSTVEGDSMQKVADYFGVPPAKLFTSNDPKVILLMPGVRFMPPKED